MESSSRITKVLPGAQNGAASRLVARIIDLVDTFCINGYMANLRDHVLLTSIYLRLARGIDHAIANNEVPLRARDLPRLLYQVLVYSKDATIGSALLRLMMCIDGACNLDWFSPEDTTILHWLTEELFRNFSATKHVRFSPSVHSSMVKVMSRFYPTMKMDEMLISLEFQPGSESYVTNFHIIRGMVDPKKHKLWLLVAQIDNMDTSSCLITPPEVNFLLNGKEVARRSFGSMDRTPQLPTNVTHMMKYGVNVLQVVGEFPGQYVVIIAIMRTVSGSGAQVLQRYVSPAALHNKETATIETRFIVSLNCPISQSRMRTPVKGQKCDHPQCFDCDNFLDINSKSPSWQCPHCKQSACHVDLRIDRTLLKVLMEAEEDVVDVFLSLDGSWEKIEDQSPPGKDTLLHDHDKNGSAVGNSTPNRQNISSDLDLTVDSCMDLLMTDAAAAASLDLNIPADDKISDILNVGNESSP